MKIIGKIVREPLDGAGYLYVSPQGKTGAADGNCHSAAYSSVQATVEAAAAHGTVVVCRGT